jgi:hypothetical protein
MVLIRKIGSSSELSYCDYCHLFVALVTLRCPCRGTCKESFNGEKRVCYQMSTPLHVDEMTEKFDSLEDALRAHIERYGGVVVERLIAAMKLAYDPEAPELASYEAFKEFINSKPDVFRISTSINNVERARLANPRRASKGLIGLTIKALEDFVRPKTLQ